MIRVYLEEDMTHVESKSETPASMYDWRVAALDAWLNSKSDGGKKPITMEMLNEAGHLDQCVTIPPKKMNPKLFSVTIFF